MAAAGLSSQLHRGRGAEPCPAPCGERGAAGPVPCPLRALSIAAPRREGTGCATQAALEGGQGPAGGFQPHTLLS